MDESRILIQGLTFEGLTQACQSLGQPAYRIQQIWKWLYVQRVSSWDAMTNLPAALRKELATRFQLLAAEQIDTLRTADGTEKLLLHLRDGESIESVIIQTHSVSSGMHRTVCVSSQVGCRFRCAFCASGQSGFKRNLNAGEIVGQVILAQQALDREPAPAPSERPSSQNHPPANRIANVVFMGIGEPFDNYDAVLRAVRILNDPNGLAIGARHITISTCGLVPKIRQLATEGIQVELSVSLHAPNDALRSRLMSANRLHPLNDLMSACHDYFEATRRIITFEYTLIQGLNDSPDHAAQLIALLKKLGSPCRMNLIPLSPVEEFEGQPSGMKAARQFTETLMNAGINCTLRASKGAALKAACGQLRAGRNAATGPATEETP